MPTEEQLTDALVKAHEAGDTEAAQMFADQIKQTRAIAAPPEPSAFQHYGGMINRALGPYAVAAAGGAAAGSVPTFGLGAPAGAALGTGGLALSDLATGIKNWAVGSKTQLPSEYIADKFGSVGGMDQKPQTPMERVAYAGAQGAAGGLAGAGTLANIPRASGGLADAILQTMSKNPGVQTAAGGGAGVGGQGAAEAGYGPAIQNIASLMGGAAFGYGASKFGGSSAPTREELTAEASKQFAQARQLSFPRADIRTKLVAPLNNVLNNPADPQFNPRLHPEVAAALADLQDVASSPNQSVPFTRLEQTRRLLTKASISSEPDERRVAGMALQELDGFVNSSAAKDARQLWSQRGKSDTVQAAIDKASLAPGDQTAAIRSQFRTLANQLAKNPRGFTDNEVQAIRDVANGSRTERALQFIGSFAPGGSIRGMGAGAGALYYAHTYPLATGGLVGASLAARTVANAMARRSTQNLGQIIRSGPTVPAESIMPYTITPATAEILRRSGGQ